MTCARSVGPDRAPNDRMEGGPTGTTEFPGGGGAEAVPSAGWRSVGAALDATEGQSHE